MAIVERLKDVKNPVTAFVICFVTATLSAVLVICVIALAFGNIDNTGIVALIGGLIGSFGSALTSGFVIVAKSAGVGSQHNYHFPVVPEIKSDEK